MSRMNVITREELESIDMMEELAVEWAEMYEDELAINPANGSARGRLPLMRRAAVLFRDVR